jgi:hypothetical protein
MNGFKQDYVFFASGISIYLLNKILMTKGAGKISTMKVKHVRADEGAH